MYSSPRFRPRVIEAFQVKDLHFSQTQEGLDEDGFVYINIFYLTKIRGCSLKDPIPLMGVTENYEILFIFNDEAEETIGELVTEFENDGDYEERIKFISTVFPDIHFSQLYKGDTGGLSAERDVFIRLLYENKFPQLLNVF